MVFLGQAANYSAGQVWRHLFAWGTKRDFDNLREQLAQNYQASSENVALYHTGRSALTVAIKSVAPNGGARVIIPGLTCIAVVRAVKAAGCEPVFVDINPENLEYDYQQLERALKAGVEQQNSAKKSTKSAEKTSRTARDIIPIDKNGNVCYNGSIILIQNTLGISWHVDKLEKLAHKYGAKIVEDLAHSAGRIYPDGREVGTVGDAVALSFGKGKAIDTISGGAVIIRNDKTDSNVDNDKLFHLEQPMQKPKLSDRLRDRWYPLFGSIARGLWRIGLGRIFIGGLVKIDFVQRSADAELNPSHRLTYWQAKLAARQLEHLPTTPLREFRLVNNRSEVLSKLQQSGYNLDEIWYDTPVSPVRYAAEADFPAESCPNTVQIAEQIINLPTWYPKQKLAQIDEIIKPYLIEPIKPKGDA